MKQGPPPSLARPRTPPRALPLRWALPLCLLLSCDMTERNWSRCAEGVPCAPGYTCTQDFRCVLAGDGGQATDGATDLTADAPACLNNSNNSGAKPFCIGNTCGAP